MVMIYCELSLLSAILGSPHGAVPGAAAAAVRVRAGGEFNARARVRPCTGTPATQLQAARCWGLLLMGLAPPQSRVQSCLGGLSHYLRIPRRRSSHITTNLFCHHHPLSQCWTSHA